jgi:phage/plasmid-like protein (TIGR03299 family)
MGGHDPITVPLPPVILDNGTLVDMSAWSAVVDPETGHVHQPAVTTNNYRIISEQTCIEFSLALQDISADEFDQIAEATGTPPVHITSAMYLRDGAVLAICAKIADDLVLADGTSHAGLYLVVRNSHDGSMAFGAQITSVMTECMNTLTAGMRRAKSSFTIRHTKNAGDRIGEAKKALGIASKYRESFAETAEQLVNTPMPRATFEDMIRDVYPRKDDKGLAPFSEEQYALLGVLDRSTTINDAWRDTRWGGLNAVTEYETWLRKLNNTDRSEAERRLESDLWGRGSKNGQAAFDYLTRDLVTV